MIFTNSRTIKNKNVQMQIIPQIKAFPYKSAETAKPPEPVENKSTTPKIVWGPAIWFFFHSIAQKVNENSFSIIKNDLFSHIKIICQNLPCPECSTHATNYMNGIDFSKINTREDLKKMLYVFHNEVNKRLGKPEYKYSELNEKYDKANLNRIIPLFFKFFEDKHSSPRMISDDIFTQRLSNSIRKWFDKNIHYFK